MIVTITPQPLGTNNGCKQNEFHIISTSEKKHMQIMYNTTQYVARTVTEMLPSSAYPRHQSIGHIQLRFFYSLTSFYQRQHLTRTNLLGNQKLILHYMVTCIQNKAGERGLAFVCTSVNQIIYTFHVISNTMVLQVQLVSTNIKPFAPHSSEGVE